MSATISSGVIALLNKGVEDANNGNKVRARTYFKDVLAADPFNETATLWLAYLSEDPYQSVELLTPLLQRHPANELARAYLVQAQTKVAELDLLVNGSSTYTTWEHFKHTTPTREQKGIPFLGEYLIKQGLISQQQLEMALRRHKDLAERHHPKQLGMVMIEFGYITQAQLDKLIEQQNVDYYGAFFD